MNRKTIISVFGTRPEAIKMSLLSNRLSEDDELEHLVCVTSQHREMLDQVLELFGVVPDHDLNAMQPGQNLNELFAKIISGLRPILVDRKPDMVLVHGDTLTSFAAAMAAFFEQIPVGHVEAGLRSYDLMAPWPEEANRRVTSIFATCHFAPTQGAKQNLLNEGISQDRIFVTGNTVIDSLLWMRNKIRSDAEMEKKLRDRFDFLNQNGRMILVTGHRRENFGLGIKNICEAIRQISRLADDIQVVYPVHLNPNVKGPVSSMLADLPNVFLIEPQSYEPFVFLMDQSYLILTDSGGIQEEAPSLRKPILVMRETTERPEAVNAGTVELVGTNVEQIVSRSKCLLEDANYYAKMSEACNPYGDGQAIERIISVLKRL